MLAIAALIAVVISAVWNQQHAGDDRGDPRANPYYACDLAVQLLAEGESAEQSTAAQRCEEARNEGDLEAQQSMARAAWAMVGISLASFALLAATVWFAYLAWRSAERGADAARDAVTEAKQANADAKAFFAQETRPWLTLTVQQMDMEFVPVEMIHGRATWTPYFELVAENIGASPAQYVLFGSTVADGILSDADARAAAYQEAISEQDQGGPDGAHVFPRTKHDEARCVWISDRKTNGLVVYFYVFYRYAGSEDMHATARVFHLSLLRGKRDEGEAVDPVNGIVFQESMYTPKPD